MSENANSVSAGLSFVWLCAHLLGFSYGKTHLRAVFRHVNPGTRKSSSNKYFSSMRRHRGFQNSTAYPPKLNSAGLPAINLAVLRASGFGLGTGSAILLVPPPNLLKFKSLPSGGHPFGFIFASLVTQVAVEDVHSGQRATRGSAIVVDCRGGLRPIY